MIKKLLLAIIFAFFSFCTLQAESVIYLFDTFDFRQTDIHINGEEVKIPERPIWKQQNAFEWHKKSVTKLILPNEGNVMVTVDFDWAQKLYHDELPLNLADGETYYLETVSGVHSKIKILSEKEGRKMLEKAEKDSKKWMINEAIFFEN